ncbi:MFS transporter [Hortaea werneckii]|nr:MFS transporter [Hortaea werneckii]
MKTNSHKSRTQDEALDDPSESEDDGDQNGDRSERERDHLLATNSDQHGLNGSLAIGDPSTSFSTSTYGRSKENESEPIHSPSPTPSQEPHTQPGPVTWSSLPKKSQLAILTLARLSEPLTQTSLQAYMYYQLKSFRTSHDNQPPSDAVVAQQAGLLAAAFTGAQFCTAILWGRLADSEHPLLGGRKRVILIGLVGSGIGSLGFGFSRSFGAAVFWRALSGTLNGNIGVMRTMISEMVQEKRFLSRAFLLLPMTFNIGVIIGPLLGGLLADPVGSYPEIFGPGGSLGVKDGVGWLRKWPYALPNVVSAGFLFCSALGVVFGLEETLEGLRGKNDWGLETSRYLRRICLGRRKAGGYVKVGREDGMGEEDVEMNESKSEEATTNPPIKRKLSFRRIWTRNVLCTLLSHGLLAMHVGTFNALWFVFLSTPRYMPQSKNEADDSKALSLPPNYQPHAPFTFTGGLALPPPSIGTALAILGIIGITLQLLLYPPLSFRLGTITSLRASLLLFPVAYFLAPYLSIIPSTSPPPGPATGPWIWLYITLVLSVQVAGRTFALPSTTILVNNASPHPSVLGTVHGVAQSVSSAARTVGPVVFSWLYGMGLGKGVVGIAWWSMCVLAGAGAGASWLVIEGDGHEILLEGDLEAREGIKVKGNG